MPDTIWIAYRSVMGNIMSQPSCQQALAGPAAEGQSPDTIAGFLPLEDPLPGTDPFLPKPQAQWILAFLAIGVALRLVRYLVRFPLWEDECLLSSNYLDRGYLDLLRPLDYYQVCPPGFLWGQLTVVRLLGFTEYALRLIPFLCGMASLFLFRRVAGRLLRGTALVLAVGIFAVGYPMVRYTAEAKPYGCDLFLALAMLAMVVEWLRRPGEDRWLWWLAALIGPILWYSYPAVFVGGGLSLAMACALWRSGRRGWKPWAVYNLALVISFAGLMAVNHMAVDNATQTRMVGEWTDAFPPLTEPLKLLAWLFTTHAGGMLGYPAGGPHGGSALTLVCCIAGVAVLARLRQGVLLMMFLAPLGLNFAAAALHRFPYGGHVRMTLYLGPVFCMLAGLGLAAAIRRFGGPGRNVSNPGLQPLFSQNRPLAVTLTVLMVLGACGMLRDLMHPYKSTTTLRARDFARWFWSDAAQNSELVCVHTDLKEDVSPGTFDYGWSCLYLCNQRIYSPRHARGEPPQWDRVSAEWPLRCVVFRSSIEERDTRPLDRWLAKMQSRYQLVSRDTFPFAAYDKWDRTHRTTDLIEVFKFVPRDAAGTAHLP
jgi:hypothetical protein